MKTFACDFETTTDDPYHVQVWSACEIEVGSHVESAEKNCTWQPNMDKFIAWMCRQATEDICLYFHNLKFDGSYILDYLTKSADWHAAMDSNGKLLENTLSRKQFAAVFADHAYTYCVSDKNVMYYIKLKIGDCTVEIRDSLKIMPFPLAAIAKSFGTEHKKLEMDYGKKGPGYIPTDAEKQYIYNDVLVLKEGLEVYSSVAGEMIGELSLTIGSHCMRQYKHGLDNKKFNYLFPKQIDKILPTGENADMYVRRSYKGGWCYLKPQYQYRPIHACGYVYDVNSLYPSVMHSASGCYYPVGNPTYCAGAPSQAVEDMYKRGRIYYFIQVTCEFAIKPRHLPTVQIKNDTLYDSTKWLTTSDVRGIPNAVTLTMTATDWHLFLDHYDVKNLTVIDYVYYKARKGIFDDYINYWYGLKQKSKGAMRTLAKLMLNNLYGKFSTSARADYITYSSEGGKLVSTTHERVEEKRAVYIPVGAAITSWARNFTIRHAQSNYDNFVYADTDSLHMLGNKRDASDIVEDPVALCAWKNETTWDSAVFSGQKRYIEHVTEEDCEPCQPYYNVKCCGMGKVSKKILTNALEERTKTYADFRPGLVVPGNLRGQRVCGGIYLKTQDFTFRKRKNEENI